MDNTANKKELRGAVPYPQLQGLGLGSAQVQNPCVGLHRHHEEVLCNNTAQNVNPLLQSLTMGDKLCIQSHFSATTSPKNLLTLWQISIAIYVADKTLYCFYCKSRATVVNIQGHSSLLNLNFIMSCIRVLHFKKKESVVQKRGKVFL